MDEVGLFIISQIQIRTAEGKDVNGVDFVPYTVPYKLFRESKGHTGDKVNLFFTGAMMSSQTHSATDDSVRVFFMGTEDGSGASNPLKAYALNKKRNFFALSGDDQREIERMIWEHIETVLEGGHG